MLLCAVFPTKLLWGIRIARPSNVVCFQPGVCIESKRNVIDIESLGLMSISREEPRGLASGICQEASPSVLRFCACKFAFDVTNQDGVAWVVDPCR